jgi:Ca2+-binding EF-hand superfamily protein
MTIQFKKMAVIVSALLSTVAFSSSASADVNLGTGGYVRELHTMGMMKMIDANGDHMVSQDEFTTYYGEIFDMLDTNKDGALDAKEWVGVKGKQEISIATGGYATQLRTMKMMGRLDTDGDHNVTKEEFLNFHTATFKNMDKKGEGMITAQEWAGKILSGK